MMGILETQECEQVEEILLQQYNLIICAKHFLFTNPAAFFPLHPKGHILYYASNGDAAEKANVTCALLDEKLIF